MFQYYRIDIAIRPQQTNQNRSVFLLWILRRTGKYPPLVFRFCNRVLYVFAERISAGTNENWTFPAERLRDAYHDTTSIGAPPNGVYTARVNRI